jgi:hypothetical protein
MFKKYIILFLMSFFFIVGPTYPKTLSFNFNAQEPQWIFYGEGLGSYVTENGDSIKLSTDWGESETAYFTWKDLSPGLYKVVTYVKAQDVQKGADGFSFWHFYDGGFGTKSPFMDLHGDYDWRKVEYTIKVKASELTIWFRLKSPGTIWVDKLTLEPVQSSDEKVILENPRPLNTQVTINKNQKILPKKKLYSFEGSESGHPFKLKNKAGEFSSHDYSNFKVSKLPIKDWTGYDRLEMDVFNPNSQYAPFYVTLADNKTTDYWSQTNYKQTLAPGWNRLSFSLTQYVGERGSHRFDRAINLAKLEKFFITIDPESKLSIENNHFLIDNIYLSSNPYPAIPEGVKAFDFTSHKAASTSNLIKITTQTNYNDSRGFGFVDPVFWRVEDSEYASEVDRYSIGLLSGHFRVKLPNGLYQVSLNINKLGYWDVPFWSERSVSINGSTLFKESRDKGKDFLTDLLMFDSIVPTSKDHPYDLYLAKIFKSIDKSVEVKNGVLDLDFKGDPTGVALNSLIIWKKSLDSVGSLYKNQLEKRNRLEFDWMSRSIQKDPKAIKNFSVAVVEPDLTMNPTNVKKTLSESLNFQGGTGENPYQVMQLTAGPTDENISLNFSELSNSKGEKLSKEFLSINDVIFQYTSPDTNHETYLITGKYLRPLSFGKSIMLKKNESRYLWLGIAINEQTPRGVFKGEVLIKRNGGQNKLPIQVTVLPYSLPKIEFPVGFFGIDPLPYSYFKNNDYNELRKRYRYMALKKIGEAGFTTFTGLPENVEELDELFKESKKYGFQTVYSYGGQFPQTRLDLNKKPTDMSEDKFYKKAADELKDLFNKKSWPKIVHTFSDEAGGYSDKVAVDIEKAKKYQKYFPFMSLGGFGSFDGAEASKLNNFFEYGFYSSLNKSDITKLKDKGLRWGFYNASAGNLDDPRFSYGLGLFIARQNGLSQYLEWNSTAFNNYPFYDFDGRESDVVMFYPTIDGKLFNSVRFELSVEGLHSYMKLKLLENILATKNNSSLELKAAKEWLSTIKNENSFYSSATFMSQKNMNFKELMTNLNKHLTQLFPIK